MTRPSRAVAALCACQGALAFGQGLAFPFFAVYLHRQRGIPLALTGLWLSLGVLATAVSQGLGGELSDRFGRRRVMALALWGRALTVFGLAIAVHGGWSTASLIALHVASSFVAHFFEPAARGWIADHAESRERRTAYGWLRACASGGFAVGPALGGLIADRSYPALFAASAVVCGLCALAVTTLLREARRHEPSERFSLDGLAGVASDPRFVRLCALNALISVAMAQLVVPLSLYATRFAGLSDAQIGALLSLSGLLIVVFQVPAMNRLKDTPLTATLTAGCVAYAAGYAWVGWARGFGALAAAVVVITVGEVLVPPAVHALAANMAPARKRGRYLGFLGLSRQLGSALGPVAGCAGLELASSRGLLRVDWLVVAGVALGAAAGFRALKRLVLPTEDGLAGVPVFPESADVIALGA